MLYLVEMLGRRYTTGPTITHFLLNSAAQKSYLKQYYVSIPPNRAPIVSQMDQDLLDNSQKDEEKQLAKLKILI